MFEWDSISRRKIHRNHFFVRILMLIIKSSILQCQLFTEYHRFNFFEFFYFVYLIHISMYVHNTISWKIIFVDLLVLLTHFFLLQKSRIRMDVREWHWRNPWEKHIYLLCFLFYFCLLLRQHVTANDIEYIQVRKIIYF